MGNVLIDGQRLGAKSQSLEDVLQRVPASEVLRIEILRGSDVAGDASNAAVLANVVRTRTAGGGTWMAGFEMTNEENPTPTGRLAWSGRSEDREYSIGANTYSHDHNSEGPREVTDGAGTLVARRYGGFPHEQSEHALNGQYSQALGEGKLMITGQAFVCDVRRGFLAAHHVARRRAARERNRSVHGQHAHRRSRRHLAASGQRIGR